MKHLKDFLIIDRWLYLSILFKLILVLEFLYFIFKTKNRIHMCLSKIKFQIIPCELIKEHKIKIDI